MFCKDCKHYTDRGKGLHGERQGECRAVPPVFVELGLSNSPYWQHWSYPRVSEAGPTCGLFEWRGDQ